MIDIKINITNKIATAIGTPFIVCGNSDYTVTFTFDAEWGAYQDKTARFFFIADGIEQYIDVLFSGNTCNAPVLPNIEKVMIGVYTGNLRTTTGAEVRCKRSILFGGKVHEPPTTEDVYNEILEIVSKKLGSEGGTVTGDYYKDGNTFIHEGNLELVEPKINEVLASEKLVETATGSAITVESSKAPLQQLKLYGKTTQNGTPTPTEPKELKSVGDSGSFEVGVYGGNLLEPIVKTETINGLTIDINEDGVITVNGTSTINTYVSIGTFNCIGKLTFTPNWIGERNADTYITFRPNGDSSLFIYNYAKTFEKTTDVLVGVGILLMADTYTNLVIKPMLNIGETSLPFEPYTKQSLTLTDTLRGVGDIADEKDFARGVKTQRFNASNLSSLTWQMAENYAGLFFTQDIKALNFECSHFINTRNTNVTKNSTANANLSDGQCSAKYNETDRIYIKFTECTTLEEWQTWIANNDGVIVYELAEPIETPLTETELNAYRQLMTNKGTTTILNSDGADMQVDYYVNKPNAQSVGNIHTQINKDYLKLQQAIITTGGSTL